MIFACTRLLCQAANSKTFWLAGWLAVLNYRLAMNAVLEASTCPFAPRQAFNLLLAHLSINVFKSLAPFVVMDNACAARLSW